MQEEKRNPVFALWLAAYEEQLIRLAQGISQGTGTPGVSCFPVDSGSTPEVTPE
jgi:hypothetical protein